MEGSIIGIDMNVLPSRNSRHGGVVEGDLVSDRLPWLKRIDQQPILEKHKIPTREAWRAGVSASLLSTGGAHPASSCASS